MWLQQAKGTCYIATSAEQLCHMHASLMFMHQTCSEVKVLVLLTPAEPPGSTNKL
jgi:hypothetical protein